MPEGLSPVEESRGLAEHAEYVEAEREERRNKTISVFEAALLALVAVLAAYSGWAAAKWSTESSLLLATASADRAQANAANLDALNSLNFDLTTFNDWFSAYVVGNRLAMADAKKRFSPNFRTAFEAWQATNPKPTRLPPPGRPTCRSTASPPRPEPPPSMPKLRRTMRRGRRRVRTRTIMSVPRCSWLQSFSWLASGAISTTGPSATAWPVSPLGSCCSPSCYWPPRRSHLFEQPNRRKAHSVISSQEKRSNLARTLGLTK